MAMNILPCPFCGSTDVEYEGDVTQSITIEWEDGCVVCKSCSAAGPTVERNTRDDGSWGETEVSDIAIDAWNSLRYVRVKQPN
jgi:Lar family restriction alleviation protein